MTNITTIPTTNLRFSTKTSSQKMSTCDYNIERQPKVAVWPAKPKIVIPLELQQIASKFQRQVRDFWPRRARMKCRQVIATMTDNRKRQCGHQNRKYLYLWNYDRQDHRMTIPQANLEWYNMYVMQYVWLHTRRGSIGTQHLTLSGLLAVISFLPARRYASAGLCDSDVSVRPSVGLSHAGIVPSRAKAGSWNVHHLIAPWL